MAFTQTQTLDNILLRGISFRTPANAAISSQYTLYANGNGQTYWSNSVAPPNLSSLSTAITNDVFRLSTNAAQYNSNAYSTMASMQSTLVVQSTSIIRLNNGLASTTARLLSNDQSQSNSINVLTNNFNVLSNQLGNTLSARVDAIYTSTVRYVTSTLYGISSFSTFKNDIADIRSTTNELFSTLSSTTILQNASTYASLTTNYNQAIMDAAVSTMNATNDQISSISTVIANKSDLISLSTVITNQLLSTSHGVYKFMSTSDGILDYRISTIYNSSIYVIESHIVDTQEDVFNLQQFSTTISSINNLWISSFVSTSQNIQDKYILSSITNVSNDLQNTSLSIYNLTNAYSTFSSMTILSLSQVLSTASKNNSTIKGLQYEFSIITTSSILAGIYDTFIGLEGYTSTLIGSTINTSDTFKSSLYTSTVLQNVSISQSYFNFYVSTMYASTLSTLIPSTVVFTSSMVSTLYSTSYTFMTSSLTSTMGSISNQYISTQSSLTRAIILSTQTQLQSSIIRYLSTPAATSISTFNGRQFELANQFLNATNALYIQQVTTFNSTFAGNQSTFNTLQNSSIGLIASTSAALARILSANTVILSTFSTAFGVNTSTQGSQFRSTVIIGFPSTTNFVINSTAATIYSLGAFAINSTVRNTESSTMSAFNTFMIGINNQVSTAALSTLYTQQIIDLAGSNFMGNLDFVNNRNFTVNVYDLVNGSSNYRVSYPMNSLVGLDMRKGIITLNISTVGSAYTNNNSLLRFDVYRWGVPTTVYGNMYPYISNADYMMQYEYTILNQTVYTNLLNVYPRLAVRNAQISSIVKNVYIGDSNTYSSNHFWRGTPIQIGWSNYSYFPYGMLGAPPYNPEVAVDVLVNNTIVAEYGPYPLSQSTVTITAPYLTNQLVPVIPTQVRTYLVGKQRDYIETSFNTVMPTFDTMSLYPNGYPNANKFIGGTELVAITDNTRYPVYNTLTNVATFASSIQYFMNDPQYAPQNIVNGILNRVGANGQDYTLIVIGASNVQGQFGENSSNSGYPDFYVTLPDYFPEMNILQQYGAQFTFTINNATSSYTFPARNISSIGVNQYNNFYRIFNTSLTKTTNTFNVIGQSCFIRYKYTPVQYISTSALYSESTFVGPIAAGTPDPATFLTINGMALTSRMDPVSTVTFYNLSNAPITRADVDGMSINAALVYNNITYGSTIRTNTNLTQTFRF